MFEGVVVLKGVCFKGFGKEVFLEKWVVVDLW